MDSALKFALAALSSDPNLDPMRFKLVPKKLKDEQFWRNYFYRVSLLREQMDVEPLFFLVEKVIFTSFWDQYVSSFRLSSMLQSTFPNPSSFPFRRNMFLFLSALSSQICQHLFAHLQNPVNLRIMVRGSILVN